MSKIELKTQYNFTVSFLSQERLMSFWNLVWFFCGLTLRSRWGRNLNSLLSGVQDIAHLVLLPGPGEEKEVGQREARGQANTLCWLSCRVKGRHHLQPSYSTKGIVLDSEYWVSENSANGNVLHILHELHTALTSFGLLLTFLDFVRRQQKARVWLRAYLPR